MHQAENVFFIILRTTFIYSFVIVLFRIFGRKHTTSISISDIILVVLIGSAVKDAMTGGDETWWGGAISGATLLLINYIVDYVSFKNKKIRTAIEGEPLILVRNGKYVKSNMEKALLSDDEFMVKMRHHEVKSLDEIKYAILEVDGSVTFIRKE